MQDLDFFIKQNAPYIPPQMEPQEGDYFMKTARSIQREEDRVQNRASRMIALVAVLCIGSFTGGLIVGIKFAGGPDKQIIDPHTQKAVSNIRNSVSTMISNTETAAQPAVGKEENRPVTQIYPKEEYPYVLRIGSLYPETESKKAADFLSKKGHTVIVARQGEKFKLYAGPFKTESDGDSSLKKILAYKDQAYYKNAVLLKR